MQYVTLYSNEPILALGFASAISGNTGFEFSGVYSDLSTLVNQISSQEPDVLLMDFKPEEDFASLLELRSAVPRCKIVLWVHGISIEVAYHAMRLGIRGILRKTYGLELLLKCLQKVASGELWFEKELTTGFMMARTVHLTPRESQLVTLVSEGLKNKEIATALTISEATVRMYISALFRKLGVKDRYELAIYGMKNMSHWQLPAEGTTGENSGVRQNLRFIVLEKPPARAALSLSEDALNPPSVRKIVS